MTARLEYATPGALARTPAQRREEILAQPTFGRHFTDHMVTATWSVERGWHDGALQPYQPISLDPAAGVLHFGQEIFEALRGFRHADGTIALFRPDANGERFRRSAHRLALPELEVDDFVAALDLLVRTDRDWVPSGEGRGLYLRPFMFASEPFLHVRPSRRVTFVVIAAPVASYFGDDTEPTPVSIWLAGDHTRAAVGGTGAAKCGGNYASSLQAQQEAIANGCDQVLFLDARERRWLEEIGSMNVFSVHADGRIVTPELAGTILPGITRDSILLLARDLGLTAEERQIDVEEWRDSIARGEITEVFGCGTAAVVAPIGMLRWRTGELRVGTGTIGPVTSRLRRALLDVQYGRSPDRHGWLHEVC